MKHNIRLAQLSDTAQVLAIYAPFVTGTAVSFEYKIPRLADFEERVQAYQPYLVCDIEGEIVGYAYASLHRSRAAYQWTRETSVYVHPDFHRRGIAQELYTTLLGMLKEEGIQNVLAGITLPNKKSVSFHEHFGFSKIGVFSKIGFKFEAWHDVGWWELGIKN